MAFSDLYQRVWVDQENPLDEYEGITYIKSFEGLDDGIMVRDEYHSIWDFVKSEYQVRALSDGLIECGGLVVTGQPGIGKTLFLVYALVKALQEHIPVAYCEDDSEIVIFSKDGCETIVPPAAKDSIPLRALCLVDSGAQLTQPPSILSRRNNFIVQATLPKPDRWRKWSEQRSAWKWVMNLWTKGEMECLVRLYTNLGLLPPPDPHRYSPLELYDIVGPSPRDCMSIITRETFVKTPEGPETTHVYGRTATLLSDTSALEHVIKTGDCPSAEQEDFHTFFFGKSDGPNPHGLSPQFRYVVPTRYLEDCLSDYIIKEKVEERYRLLCAFAPLPQAFAPVRESYIVSHMHDRRDSLPCYLLSNPKSPSFQIPAGLSLGKLPVEPGLGTTEYCDNTIYVTRSGFPSLDAFIISDNMTRVTMVQITVSDRHAFNTLGVYRVIDRVKEELPSIESVQWSFLFVAPGENGNKAAETQKAHNLEFRKEDPEVRIGWISTADEMVLKK